MKVTQALIRQFEHDQREHGTRIAIHNLIWSLLARQFDDLGVRRLTTSYFGRKVRARFTRRT